MCVVSQALAGKRVLIVEDEALVALLIEEALSEFGCVAVGPCSTLAEALGAAATETFDLALLDINLFGEKVYPVAYALAERQIPFLLMSGYGAAGIPPDRRDDWKLCAKPFKVNELAAMLSALMVDASPR
jgi:DNA-binding response OmpR family regulator